MGRMAGRAGGVGGALAVVMLFLSLFGCGAKSNPAEGAKPAKESPAQVEAAVAKPPAESGSPESTSTTSEAMSSMSSGEAPEESTDSPAEEPQSAPSDAPPAAVQRFVWFTWRGPLVAHLEIHIDGQPQSAAVEQLLADVRKALGQEGTDDPTWDELCENAEIQRGVFGNAPLPNPAVRRSMVEQFDRNRDGRAQRGELAAFLAQSNNNTNNSGEAFALRAVREYGGKDTEDGLLFRLFDADENGRLSARELAGAASRLRSRDADDNELVTLADVRLQPIGMQMRRERRDNLPDAAAEITEVVSDSVYYTLYDRYDEGRGLTAENLGLTPGLHAALDRDGDGRIAKQEIAGLKEARPDLYLKVEFGQEGGPARLTLLGTSEDLQAAGVTVRADEKTSGLRLELEGLFLYVQAGDVAGEPPRQGRDVPLRYTDLQVQGRVGEVEDPLFSWLDQDADGRLSWHEIEQAAARLARWDRDGDGGLTSDEIPRSMSCVLVRGTAANNLPGFGPLLATRRPSEMPGWLAAMDRNDDGGVSWREFLGSPEQFAQLDADENGWIDASEAQRANHSRDRQAEVGH